MAFQGEHNVLFGVCDLEVEVRAIGIAKTNRLQKYHFF